MGDCGDGGYWSARHYRYCYCDCQSNEKTAFRSPLQHTVTRTEAGHLWTARSYGLSEHLSLALISLYVLFASE